jgi:hypothetical protein
MLLTGGYKIEGMTSGMSLQMPFGLLLFAEEALVLQLSIFKLPKMI